jgi:hypothetical protein
MNAAPSLFPVPKRDAAKLEYQKGRALLTGAERTGHIRGLAALMIPA